LETALPYLFSPPVGWGDEHKRLQDMVGKHYSGAGHMRNSCLGSGLQRRPLSNEPIKYILHFNWSQNAIGKGL